MSALDSFFAMGGYAKYVWPAYGIAAVVLAGMVWTSMSAYRRAKRDLEAAQAARPPRR